MVTKVNEIDENFEIPVGVERVVLMIRHAQAVPVGTDSNKLLSLEGLAQCLAVQAFYTGLVHAITQTHGNPVYYCSEYPRSLHTAWEIFHPDNINREDSLTFHESLLNFQGGEWVKARIIQGLSEPGYIRKFLEELDFPGNEGFLRDRDQYLRFITSGSNSKTGKDAFSVAVGHEVSISMAGIAAGLNLSEVGLDKCDGIAFFVTGGHVVGAQRIVPTKTETQDLFTGRP